MPSLVTDSWPRTRAWTMPNQASSCVMHLWRYYTHTQVWTAPDKIKCRLHLAGVGAHCTKPELGWCGLHQAGSPNRCPKNAVTRESCLCKLSPFPPLITSYEQCTWAANALTQMLNVDKPIYLLWEWTRTGKSQILYSSLKIATVFIPINAVVFILFKSVVGGGVYWRAVFIGGRRLIVRTTVAWVLYPVYQYKQ